jgi:hypothetical protein
VNRITYTLHLLRQPSTWAGLGVLAGLAGLHAEQWQAVAHAGAAVAGLVAVLMNEPGAPR